MDTIVEFLNTIYKRVNSHTSYPQASIGASVFLTEKPPTKSGRANVLKILNRLIARLFGR